MDRQDTDGSQAGFQGFIGIHVGVGKHSSANEAEYKKTCKTACKKAIAVLKQGKSSLDALAVALAVLEDSPNTNAGFGSNLTELGEVECDASVMDGQSMGFGAVGAVKGIMNPSQVAYGILTEEIKGTTNLGLVPPIFLVGQGAARWAKQHGIPDVPHEKLISEKSLASFKKYKARLDAIKEKQADPRKKRKLEDLCTLAAMYGGGCWTRNATRERNVGVACSTTGCGEYLMKTMLARGCAEMAISRDGFSAVNAALQETFLDSPCLTSAEQKLAGVILLKTTNLHKGLEVEFVWGHTATSMCVGYMSTLDSKPKVRVCRSSTSDSDQTKPLLIEGIICRLDVDSDVT